MRYGQHYYVPDGLGRFLFLVFYVQHFVLVSLASFTLDVSSVRGEWYRGRRHIFIIRTWVRMVNIFSAVGVVFFCFSIIKTRRGIGVIGLSEPLFMLDSFIHKLTVGLGMAGTLKNILHYDIPI